MNLNPKNKIIDGVIKTHLDQFSKEETEEDQPAWPSEREDDLVSFNLYEEWLRTPSHVSTPNPENLFDSIASRLHISRKKRNSDISEMKKTHKP